MSDKDISNFDQATALIANSFPPLWRRTYLNLIESGFSEEQAMKLLMAYIHGIAGGRLS